MSSQQVIEDFQHVRDERRAAALADYRRVVASIASGEGDARKFAKRLDDAMRLLSVTEDDLAHDVAALKDHARSREAAEALEAQRGEALERVAHWKAKFQEAQEWFVHAEQRAREAEEKLRASEAPLTRLREHQQRVARLEAENGRLFAPPADDDG